VLVGFSDGHVCDHEVCLVSHCIVARFVVTFVTVTQLPFAYAVKGNVSEREASEVKEKKR
jgi:hypothetical protein